MPGIIENFLKALQFSLFLNDSFKLNARFIGCIEKGIIYLRRIKTKL